MKKFLYSRALDEAADGIQVTDLTGHILYSNKAVERIYGYTPQYPKTWPLAGRAAGQA